MVTELASGGAGTLTLGVWSQDLRLYPIVTCDPVSLRDGRRSTVATYPNIHIRLMMKMIYVLVARVRWGGEATGVIL